MQGKKFFFGLVAVAVLVILLSQIKATKSVVGEDIDYNRSWEETSEKFPILDYVPRFTDTVDYWKNGKVESYGFLPVHIGLREVEDASGKMKEIVRLLEADGFTVTGEEDVGKGYERDVLDTKSISLRKSLSAGELGGIAITIEYFEYKYKYSHNIYIRINPAGK